jgi:hypothetical protein
MVNKHSDIDYLTLNKHAHLPNLTIENYCAFSTGIVTSALGTRFRNGLPSRSGNSRTAADVIASDSPGQAEWQYARIVSEAGLTMQRVEQEGGMNQGPFLHVCQLSRAADEDMLGILSSGKVGPTAAG